MPISNTQSQYGSITKLFHWLTAALILAIIPLGAIANRLPLTNEAEITRVFWMFGLHKTLGVAVFFIALLRILWALSQTKPGSLHPERKGETLAAETVHWLLYGSLVIVPLSGWIHHAAVTGFAPIWWPFSQNLPFVPKDEGIAHTFELIHWIMSKVMIGALLLHVAGALKHAFVDKDSTLRRMWFGKSNAPDVQAHRSPAAAPFLAAGLFVLAGAGIIMTDKDKPEAAPLAANTSNWEVQDGSTLDISIMQLGSETTGSFAEWNADIDFDPAAQSGEVTVTIAIESLTLGSVTDQAMGADFFNVAEFPTATFSGPIMNTAGTDYVSEGNLTMKGLTLPLTLTFTLSEADNVWSMNGTSTIKRLDYGIGESMPEDDSVGFDVVVTAKLTAIQTSE